MGRMFMTASMMLRKAVMFQKICQSHIEGKRLAMVMNEPTDWAPSLENRYLSEMT